MSINALTNAAIARRPDFHPAADVPHGLGEIARAAGLMPAPAPAGAAAPAPAPAPSAVETSLQTLTTYIPTEVLTLYVAVIAALSPVKDQAGQAVGSWPAFWTFFVATPLVSWIVFATKVQSAGKQIPWLPRTWPLWEMFAGAIAFSAWAFALPNTPFLQETWYSQSIAGVVVLVTSSLLGLVAPLMQRPLSAT